MGTPDFAVSSLQRLIGEKYDVVGIVTVPDKPSGRGLDLHCSAVKQYVIDNKLDIPILQPALLKDPAFLDELSALKADLFVVVAFRMLPRQVWAMPPKGTFNLHASLLPRYRGAAPINWAIINGETMTGVTTFFLDEKIDTGAVIYMQDIPILPSDNVETLHDKLAEAGASLVTRTVDAIASDNVISSPQSSADASPAPKLTRENTAVDWSASSERIHNLIRGLSPYPAAHSVLVAQGRRIEVKIFSSHLPEECDKKKKPVGSIFSDGKNILRVYCSSGCLDITELQVAGRKRLKASEFLAGWHGDWTGVKFE